MVIRLLLAEDQDLIRVALASFLAKERDLDVVGQASTGREAVELSVKLQPDVALLDFEMPEMNGADAAQQIRKLAPAVHVIMVSSYADERSVRRAVRSGVRGYLPKATQADELVRAVRAVAKNDVYFSPAITAQLAKWISDPRLTSEDPLERLSPRQRQILGLIATGKTTKEIAFELGLSVSTIDTHRTALMRRLDIHDLATLVRFAIEHGLVRL